MAQPSVVRRKWASEQPEGGEPDPTVPGHEAVAAHDVVDPGHPRHEQDAHERQVRAQQRRDLPGAREEAGQGTDLLQASVPDPHAGHDRRR